MNEGAPEKMRLRLYVAGATARSHMAETRIRNICDEKFGGNYDLDVIDVCQNPELAERDNIIAAPTLIKEHAGFVGRIVGDFADLSRLMLLLDG